MKVTLRGRSPSHLPKKNAVWTLSALREEVDYFLIEIFPKTPHEGILGLPGLLFDKSVADQGDRPRRYIPYNDAFRIVTMPLFNRQPKVRHNRGIRVNYFWYWNNELVDARWRGKKVTVRYDPQDAGFVEALLGTRWVRCESASSLIIGYPWRDIESLTHECVAESRLTNNRKRVAPIDLERYIARVRAKEVELARQKRDRLSPLAKPADQSNGASRPPAVRPKDKKRKLSTCDFEQKPTVRIGTYNA